MASSHVPKFGNWDDDNIPYTACFENARKEKVGVKMNPNDPEENPEAFMYMRGDLEIKVHGNCGPVNPDKSAEANYSTEGNKRQNAPLKNSFDSHKGRRSHRSITSESSSEKSSSDQSHQQGGHRHAKSDRRKGLADGSSNSFSTSVVRHSKQRSGGYPFEANHHRAASIPKFGAWDETDPASGEGFTVIFNKVKEEKQSASSKYRTVPRQPSSYSDIKRKDRTSSSSASKICGCCFRP